MATNWVSKVCHYHDMLSLGCHQLTSKQGLVQPSMGKTDKVQLRKIECHCSMHLTAHYGNECQCCEKYLKRGIYFSHLEPAVLLNVMHSIFLVSNSLHRILLAESLHQGDCRPEIDPFRFFVLLFLKCLTFLLKLNHPLSSVKCCYPFQT